MRGPVQFALSIGDRRTRPAHRPRRLDLVGAMTEPTAKLSGKDRHAGKAKRRRRFSDMFSIPAVQLQPRTRQIETAAAHIGLHASHVFKGAVETASGHPDGAGDLGDVGIGFRVGRVQQLHRPVADCSIDGVAVTR